MPIVAMEDMLQHAYDHGYAIGGFDEAAQVAYRAFYLSVAKKQLHSSQILGPAIDQGCLCAPRIQKRILR